MNYQPSIGQAVLTAFIALVFLGLTTFAKGRWLVVLNIGFILFLIMTVLIWWMMVTGHYVESHIRQTDAMTDWMQEWNKMDDSGRQIMSGKFFPTIKYKLKEGVISEEFESTKVLIGLWRKFLETSDSQYVSPQRDWVTKEMPPSAWLAIFGHLVREGYAYDQTASGNHSHMWVGESYNHLSAQWRMAGRKLIDMGKAERIAAAIDRNYAANDD